MIVGKYENYLFSKIRLLKTPPLTDKDTYRLRSKRWKPPIKQIPGNHSAVAVLTSDNATADLLSGEIRKTFFISCCNRVLNATGRLRDRTASPCQWMQKDSIPLQYPEAVGPRSSSGYHEGCVCVRETLAKLWLLEGNSSDIGKGENFLKRTPVAQQTTPRVDRCGYVNSKGLCTAEGTITRVKRQNWGVYLRG